MIIYMYCRNLQFLNKVIINRKNVLILQSYDTLADFGHSLSNIMSVPDGDYSRNK